MYDSTNLSTSRHSSSLVIFILRYLSSYPVTFVTIYFSLFLRSILSPKNKIRRILFQYYLQCEFINARIDLRKQTRSVGRSLIGECFPEVVSSRPGLKTDFVRKNYTLFVVDNLKLEDVTRENDLVFI